MTDNLEPCPECDSRELAMDKVAARSAYRVVCTLCGGRGLYRRTEAAARRVWNACKRIGPRLTPPEGE